MTTEVDCEGAPRDMGVNQGLVCRGELQAGFGALSFGERLRCWFDASPAARKRVARDMNRHFPHQSETLEGIARGAGVPKLGRLGPKEGPVAGVSTSPAVIGTRVKASGRAMVGPCPSIVNAIGGG